MKDFVRNNLMIVVSVALPLLVVAFFAVATLLPRAAVEPPAWNLIFAMQTAPNRAPLEPLQFTVDVANGRLRARAWPADPPIRQGLPRIFEYVSADGTLRETSLELPDGFEAAPGGTSIPVPDYADREIVSTLTAPDGWRFDASYRSGGGLFRELFGAGRRRYGPRITRDGASLAIDLPSIEPYYYAASSFVGWAEP